MYCWWLWCPRDGSSAFVWQEIALMEFWVKSHLCAWSYRRVLVHIQYVMEFQSRCIWLTSLPGPLIFLMALIPLLQRWKRPFSRQLNTLFGNCACVEERWALDGWHCPGICPRQKVDPILQTLAAGDLALLQHKWLWSTARGQKAKNEEMKVYEAPKRDYMDISTVILPDKDEVLSAAKYLRQWWTPVKDPKSSTLALKFKLSNVWFFAPVSKNSNRIWK